MTMESADPWASLNTPARTPRTLDTRERTQKRTQWSPPQLLPDPDPRDGYTFRWVRSETLGVIDKKNYSQKIREGWEPVRAEDHPEVVAGLNVSNGLVEVGGLVLCKMPTEMVEQRRAYYRDRTKQENDAADNAYLAESDPRMKKFSQRRTSFGRAP